MAGGSASHSLRFPAAGRRGMRRSASQQQPAGTGDRVGSSALRRGEPVEGCPFRKNGGRGGEKPLALAVGPFSGSDPRSGGIGIFPSEDCAKNGPRK